MNAFFDYVRDLRMKGLEFVSGRYYSKYIGRVTTGDDPQGQGRVRVSCEVATGRDQELSLFAYPSAQYGGEDKGMFFPPDEGDAVWVEFAHGDVSVPRLAGAFWCNRQQDKKPAGSFVPAEFNPGTSAPTKRGIKTRKTGLLFEDTEDAEKVELWTGRQPAAGQPHDRRHQVRLDDTSGAEQIVVSSFAGHQTSWIDIVGKKAIESVSEKGHFIKIIDEPTEKIVLQMTNGAKIEIDKTTGVITVVTAGQQKIEMTDSPAAVNITDATGNSIKMTPAGVNIISATLVDVTAAAAVTVNAAAAATINAAGPLALNGATVAVVSKGVGTETIAGAKTEDITGAKTETVKGAKTVAVTGLLTINSLAAVLLQSPVTVGIGNPAPVKFRLIDERFLTQFLAHTHQFTDSLAITGTTTVPVDQDTGSPPLVLAVEQVATTTLRGN